MKTLNDLLKTKPEDLTTVDKLAIRFNGFYGYNYKLKYPTYEGS
ncbi:unnamed protein product [marine sediment metagenome]|uniref:Uncharacterized protein n=1 Tax=marine sediment metagenome TaxID=412755 RepID=X0WBS5_9ZZZZ